MLWASRLLAMAKDIDGIRFIVVSEVFFQFIITLHDAYCQQHDEISKIKSIFYYQMLYPNIKN
jgi:hypothetical protein